MTATGRSPIHAACTVELLGAGHSDDAPPRSTMATQGFKPRERELYEMFVGLADRVEASPIWSDVELATRRLFAQREDEGASDAP